MNPICDGSVTGSTAAFQAAGGGSSPAPSLQFSTSTLKEVSAFVKQTHYSHSHAGTNVSYVFKITDSGVIVGAALFGFMGGNPKAACVVVGHEDAHEYRELSRLCLADVCPKNTESQFIAWCIRWLRKNTSLIALISFADPKFGHSGTIYRASNWIYTGLQKQDRPRLIINGVEKHPKVLYNSYGTSSVKKLEELGMSVTQSPRQPKNRYIYLLRPGLTLKDRVCPKRFLLS